VKDHSPGFTLITIKGEQWTFASANADTITKLLSIFLDGLRRRSRWAVAIQDFIVQGTTRQLSLLSLLGREMSVGQRAVMLRDAAVK